MVVAMGSGGGGGRGACPSSVPLTVWTCQEHRFSVTLVLLEEWLVFSISDKVKSYSHSHSHTVK